MLSDRAPFEYLYLSRRLLTELTKHDEATRPRVQRELSFSFKFFSYSGKRRPPDFSNLHDLAMRSSDLVSDHVGRLDAHWIPQYVEHEIQMSRGVFSPHIGWGGEVACFQGELTTMAGLRIFVALFGSASNLVGYHASDDKLRGFTPSDITGLYSLLDAVREPDDPEISLDSRVDDYHLTNDHRVEVAINYARGGARQGPEKLGFLARNLLCVDNYQGRADTFDRVLIGTPLWIRTPEPTPSPNGIPTP